MMKTMLTAAMLTVTLMGGAALAQDKSGQSMQSENKMADTMMKKDDHMMKGHKQAKHKSKKKSHKKSMSMTSRGNSM